jgi:hypothetical protein
MMDIPASLTDLIGQRILRLATSYNGQIFFLDIPKVREFGNRTRFAYILDNGDGEDGIAEVMRSENLAPLLGNVLLDVFDGGYEEPDLRKLVFKTNPTELEFEYSILYLGPPPEYLITEEGEYVITEQGEYVILEKSENVSIDDYPIGKLTFGDVNSEIKLFVFQEDDFDREEEYHAPD